jgi:dihydroorotate dehydrogenase
MKFCKPFGPAVGLPKSKEELMVLAKLTLAVSVKVVKSVVTTETVQAW